MFKIQKFYLTIIVSNLKTTLMNKNLTKFNPTLPTMISNLKISKKVLTSSTTTKML